MSSPSTSQCPFVGYFTPRFDELNSKIDKLISLSKKCPMSKAPDNPSDPPEEVRVEQKTNLN